jgi:hypothetical protein
MDMHRPLFYALRYSRLFLETPIPEFLMWPVKRGNRPARSFV